MANKTKEQTEFSHVPGFTDTDTVWVPALLTSGPMAMLMN